MSMFFLHSVFRYKYIHICWCKKQKTKQKHNNNFWLMCWPCSLEPQYSHINEAYEGEKAKLTVLNINNLSRCSLYILLNWPFHLWCLTIKKINIPALSSSQSEYSLWLPSISYMKQCFCLFNRPAVNSLRKKKKIHEWKRALIYCVLPVPGGRDRVIVMQLRVSTATCSVVSSLGYEAQMSPMLETPEMWLGMWSEADRPQRD